MIIFDVMTKMNELIASLHKLAEGVTPKEDADSFLKDMLEGLSEFPWSSGRVDTLGGEDKPSVAFTVALTPKTEWKNGILQNAKHAKFIVHWPDKALELIAGYKIPKFRKTRFKSNADAVSKIVKFLNTAT